jgi:predicted metal-binding transcription factor (methanogenesis marker protein 9)
MKSREFTATVGDKEIEFTVVSPSLKDRKEADKIYNNAFTEALQSKAVVRARLDDLLVDQGLWDENKQQKFDTLQKNILDNEKKLAQGGIPLKSAREIALKMRKDRSQMRELISVKTNLDTHTAEGQADNAKFNYLVYACTLNKETQTKYFNSYEDYMEHSSEEVAVSAAQNLANMIYGLEANYEHKLPENEFLINYKFVNKDLRFINKEGKLVDEEGRLVDESGRFINEAGEYVDKYGNPVDSEGDYKVDFAPFLDDEGNPVGLEEEEKTESTSKKTTKKSSQSKAKENES